MGSALVTLVVTAVVGGMSWAMMVKLLRRRKNVYDRSGYSSMALLPALHIAGAIIYFTTATELFSTFDIGKYEAGADAASSETLSELVGNFTSLAYWVTGLLLLFAIVNVLLFLIRNLPFWVETIVSVIGTIVLMYFFNLIDANLHAIVDRNQIFHFSETFMNGVSMYFLVMELSMFGIIIAEVVSHILRVPAVREYYSSAPDDFEED